MGEFQNSAQIDLAAIIRVFPAVILRIQLCMKYYGDEDA